MAGPVLQGADRFFSSAALFQPLAPVRPLLSIALLQVPCYHTTEERTNEQAAIVRAVACMHGLLYDPVTLVLDLVSDVGEAAKEALRATDRGRQSPRPRRERSEENKRIGLRFA